MSKKLIQSPSGPGKAEPPQMPGNVNVERPGQNGPLSGTTGSGPKKPPTPGKAGDRNG
jgi:hypothetical protein